MDTSVSCSFMPRASAREQEIGTLTQQMSVLISAEFGVFLNAGDTGIGQQLCLYGLRSRRVELLEKAQRLAALLDTPWPSAADSASSLIELLASDCFQRPVQVFAAGVPAFVVDKLNRRFWSTVAIRHLRNLDKVTVKFIRTQALSQTDIERLETRHCLTDLSGQVLAMKSSQLEEFFCFAGKYFSHGRLLNAISQFKQIRLTRWPDMCRQVEYRNYTRMAIYLMQHKVAPAEFVQQPVTDKNDAISFLNICYLCGYLRVYYSSNPVDKKDHQAASIDDGKRELRLGFISRIRSKLGM